jgi:ubiquinone/menaquinone biosynthesis C-methylase UbiE
MLPQTHRPRILDVGCGHGEPTLQLAELSQGVVVGLDIDRGALTSFALKIAERDLTERVHPVLGSLLEMGFRDEAFDILWAEGSIFAIGFERGLKAWKRLIKLGGHMVVHEAVWLRPNPPRQIHDEMMARFGRIRMVQENVELIPACGYDAIGHFALPEDAWWRIYYGPLQERVQVLRREHANDPDALEALAREQREIDRFKKSQQWFGSAYFVMQKSAR